MWLSLLASSALPSLADEAEVAAIRQAYQAIEDGKNWVKKVVEIPGEKDPEMVLTRYETKDGVLKKLVAKTLDDHGTGTERYYFSEGRVFFLFQKAAYWTHIWELDENGEQRSTPATKNGEFERRVYYVDGKCVRHLLKEGVGADEKAARAAFAKSTNKAFDDPEMGKLYQDRGVRLAGITTRKKLEAILGR